MKKKSNAIIYVLLTLVVVNLVLGSIGLIASNNKPTTLPKQGEKDYKVTYKYYVDGSEVKEAIEQEEIQIDGEFEGSKVTKKVYSFDKYLCTNNVTGEWNDEKWEFNPNLTSNTTCRLYFNKNFHEVKILATNGVLPNNTKEQNKTIELESEVKINVLPTDGYKFNGVECTNSAKAEYDETTHDLTIKDVTKDNTTCTVTFGVSDYTVKVSVDNGSPATSSKSIKYGENAVFDITPAQDYGDPVINCSNDQKATFSDGKLTVTSITNNSECSVKFSYTIVKNKVTLKVNHGTIVSDDFQEVLLGKSAVFGIVSDEGYSLTDPELKCTKTDGSASNATIKMASSIIVSNVDGDLNCEVTLKEATN